MERRRRHLAVLVGAALAFAGAAAGGTATTTTTTATTTTAATTTAPPATTTAPAGPVATVRPRIVGALRVGERLTADAGTWTGSGTVAYAYQWYRCDASGSHCSSIHGATGAGYRAVAADLGKTIGLTVKGTDTAGTTSAYASLAGPLTPAGAAVFVTGQPQVSGTPLVGQALTVSGGTWQGGTPTLSYSWGRCNANGRLCGEIKGATAATYTPTADDVGHALVVAVTAKVGATSVVTLSESTAAVTLPPGPRSTVRPIAAGIAKVGQRLTAASGGWAGTGTISFAFQWYRCDASVGHCSSIHGATGRTYALVAADAGRTIALTVKATDSTGTASAYASALGPIAAATAASAPAVQPVLTGTAVVGKPLLAPAGASGYSWLRCNANGRLCAAIAGAAAATYTPAAADVGHVVVALVRTAAGPALSTGAGPVTAA